jgi:predicted enzyme related to lactoylglutathione lyase
MFIYVDDLDGAVAQAGDAGGTVLREPAELP